MSISRIAVAAIGLFFATSPILAQDCGPRAVVLSMLAIDYDERPILMGNTPNGVLEIFSAPNGETFTVLVTTQDPRGIRSCMVASGKNLRPKPFAPGDPS